jgi:hypothetical protein
VGGCRRLRVAKVLWEPDDGLPVGSTGRGDTAAVAVAAAVVEGGADRGTRHLRRRHVLIILTDCPCPLPRRFLAANM